MLHHEWVTLWILDYSASNTDIQFFVKQMFHKCLSEFLYTAFGAITIELVSSTALNSHRYGSLWPTFVWPVFSRLCFISRKKTGLCSLNFGVCLWDRGAIHCIIAFTLIVIHLTSIAIYIYSKNYLVFFTALCLSYPLQVNSADGNSTFELATGLLIGPVDRANRQLSNKLLYLPQR
jgi:hypothetical protein